MKTVSGCKWMIRPVGVKRALFVTPGSLHQTGKFVLDLLIGSAFLLLFFISPVWADTGRSGTAWKDLSRKEQGLLQPFKERWNQLPSNRQEQIRRGARRWETLSPAQRRRARIQFKRWKGLSPEEKQQIRRRFKRFLRLPPKDREVLQRRREWFKDLSPERRNRLRGEWDRLSPERRERLRNRLGIDRMRRRPRTDRQHLIR